MDGDYSEVNTFFLCSVFQHAQSFFPLGYREASRSLLHEACLVPRYLSDRAAQHGGMVNRQICNACHDRLRDDICAIIFAADATFYHRCINFLAHVGMVGHKR